MSTTTLETQDAVGTAAPLPPTPARTTTLVLMAFAAVYVVWGSTYLAIRIGIESFPPLLQIGGNGRAPAPHSRPNDNSGSDGFCCRLRRLGLYLSGDPHWDRIVSAADPGGASPHFRGRDSLPGSVLGER